jgi:SAM-dependent methyltransferase
MSVSPNRSVVDRHPRHDIGRTLLGDVLEIGPGSAPFSTAPEARVTYADRSVQGGRDTTWPELKGQPRGPEADLDLDLDIDGLRAIGDEAFDVVIASHLIEHLANPIQALAEFARVLRPGGRLVLVVPDRTRTFDSVREPTPLAHVLDDFDRHVTEVDTEHITEFCHAIFEQPPIHPDEVRDWYDPSRLDDARVDLHRRRSIHVHCWSPEEFALVIAEVLARGFMAWELIDVYFFDDGPEPDIEFGLVLERPRAPSAPSDLSLAFIRDWATLVLEREDRDPRRVIALHAALLANIESATELVPNALALSEALGDNLGSARAGATACGERLAGTEAQAARLSERLSASEQQMTQVLESRSYRASRILSSTLRPFRRHG